MSVSDRLAALLLLICLAVVVLLTTFVVEGAHPGGAGAVHPEFATLRIGGDGEARSAGTLLRGWIYGALAIAFFAASFALAVHRPGLGLGPMRRAFWASTIAYQVAWALFMLSYRRFAEAPERVEFWFALPEPTALMIYVLWPLPALYMLLYLRDFRRFVWTERDEASMERLIAVTRGTEVADD